MLLKPLFLVALATLYANGANILGVFPLPGTSHWILAYKLMKGLAEAGNDVTIVSPFEVKDRPTKGGVFTDIVLDGIAEEFQAQLANHNLFDTELMTLAKRIEVMGKIFLGHVNSSMLHLKVKNLLESDARFDAVIVEQFYNDALKVFAHLYQCPLILLSSVGPNSWVNPTVGNPQPPAYAPHMFIGDFTKNNTILTRAKNLFSYVMDYLVRTFYLFPKNDRIMRQLVPDAPPIQELFTNASLVLLNSHTSIYQALPIVPNMVEIGGYFIDPPKPLPKDLQQFLDSAEHGVIYFSMGSNLKSKDLPETRKKAILSVLGRLKQKVLWKFEEDLPGKPGNVMIKKWLPQQDILAHKNVKLFITHGGLLSTTETVYHGVPILAIPVFGDQPANAERAQSAGIGLKLGYHDPNFNEATLYQMIQELLTNPKYQQNVKQRSRLFHDRPQKPMETAVYWVEYVIRHKGADHLKVAGVKLPWYQYYMVDVALSLVATLLGTVYVIKLVFRRLFCRKKSRKATKQKRN